VSQAAHLSRPEVGRSAYRHTTSTAHVGAKPLLPRLAFEPDAVRREWLIAEGRLVKLWHLEPWLDTERAQYFPEHRDGAFQLSFGRAAARPMTAVSPPLPPDRVDQSETAPHCDVTATVEDPSPSITGLQITEFLLNPTDDGDREWWPGTHLQFHVVVGASDHVGDVVQMDEYVGSWRLRMSGVVIEAVQGRRTVDSSSGACPSTCGCDSQSSTRTSDAWCVTGSRSATGGSAASSTHSFRLYDSPRFAAQLDAHVRTEIPRLCDLLRDIAVA
jgi:hypothetical protein